MPRGKRLRKLNIRDSVQSKSTDMKWFIGFGLTSAVLIILIFLTEGSQREALIIILAVLVAIGTLFFTFKPIFGDWNGFLESWESAFRLRTDWGADRYAQTRKQIQKIYFWQWLGIVAGLAVCSWLVSKLFLGLFLFLLIVGLAVWVIKVIVGEP